MGKLGPMMKSQKAFSIIELMTVVLVILLLLSLLIPTFSKLKMNAKSALCKNQMRQMHVLLTSYMSENNGYLPNDSIKDIPASPNCNNKLYANWNGHLLPYLDTGITSYHRMTSLSIKDANIYENNGMGWWFLKNASVIDPVTKSDAGWNIINETYQKGGYNDLKLFVCPEVHANSYDVGVAIDFNNLKIPRISQLSFTYIGFQGVPTNYFANNKFFGFDQPWRPIVNSLRMDQINSISKKALLIEGGLAYAKGSNGEPEYIYYVDSYGDLAAGGISKDTGGHRLNYVHDMPETFWVMNGLYNWNYFPNMWMSYDAKVQLAEKFNSAFNGHAIMTPSNYGSEIISFINPAEKPFESFFLANPPNATLNPFEPFDELEYGYLIGNMNVLFGDGAVLTKDRNWLSSNRTMISQLTQE